MVTRCAWAGTEPFYVAYHDEEWGVPVHDDRKLFEFLILESAQAGLSWATILRKRDNFREAFDQFDPQLVARYDTGKVAELLENSGIIRNRLKIQSAIKNAQAVLEIQKEFGSFDRYIWQFVGGTPIQNHWKTVNEIPSSTPLSDEMSKALKKHGFSFIGTTICYAFMQAVGLVNDHTIDCFRHAELNRV